MLTRQLFIENGIVIAAEAIKLDREIQDFHSEIPHFWTDSAASESGIASQNAQLSLGKIYAFHNEESMDIETRQIKEMLNYIKELHQGTLEWVNNQRKESE